MKIRVERNEQAARFFEDIAKLQGKVGWLESSKYPDGTPVGGIAAVHEHGAAAKGIPPRPFMRPAAEANKLEWGKVFGHGVKQAINGESDAYNAMVLLTETARGDIHKQLASMGNYPDNSDTVYGRRHRNNPPRNQSTAILRDTMVMFNTLTAVVEGKGG